LWGIPKQFDEIIHLIVSDHSDNFSEGVCFFSDFVFICLIAISAIVGPTVDAKPACGLCLVLLTSSFCLVLLTSSFFV
jgi:hypothetical protein